MLEIHILKTLHQGEGEAKKLLPYILACDVFAPEAASLTEQLAAAVESNWEAVLSSGWSRTRFLKETESARFLGDSEHKSYTLKQKDYLYQRKVPIWHVERFSPQETNEINKILKEASGINVHALRSLLKGNIDESVQGLYDSLGVMQKGYDLRDQHIGLILGTAEQKIRAQYSRLSAKEPLRLAICIGWLHSPEKHAHVPTTIHKLYEGEFPNTNDIFGKIEVAHKKGIPANEIRPLLIKAGALLLIDHYGLKLSKQQIAQMNEEEIFTAIRQLR